MGDFWLKLKVWTKTTLAGVLCIYLLIFIVKNAGETVHFWWWFGAGTEHGALTFAFVSFISGVLLTILLRTTWVTLRQIKDLQGKVKVQRADRILADQQAKAAKLQVRPSGTVVTTGGAFETREPPTKAGEV